MKKHMLKERGERARAVRVKAALSQQFMADQLGCSRQLVSHLESTGKFTGDQLAHWCVACGCSADEILFGSASLEPTGDPVEEQFARLEPWLRQRLWVLYQVFVRRGAAEKARAPS